VLLRIARHGSVSEMHTLQMQRVVAHRAPWQRVRNAHFANAACCRAQRTVAASKTQMQRVVIAQLEKHKWSLSHLKEKKKTPFSC